MRFKAEILKCRAIMVLGRNSHGLPGSGERTKPELLGVVAPTRLTAQELTGWAESEAPEPPAQPTTRAAHFHPVHVMMFQKIFGIRWAS